MNEDKASRYHRLKRWSHVASLGWTLALLVAAYFYVRQNYETWPPLRTPYPSLLIPSINPPSAVVQCSSTLSTRHDPAIHAGMSAATAGNAKRRISISFLMTTDHAAPAAARLVDFRHPP